MTGFKIGDRVVVCNSNHPHDGEVGTIAHASESGSGPWIVGMDWIVRLPTGQQFFAGNAELRRVPS